MMSLFICGEYVFAHFHCAGYLCCKVGLAQVPIWVCWSSREIVCVRRYCFICVMHVVMMCTVCVACMSLMLCVRCVRLYLFGCLSGCWVVQCCVYVILFCVMMMFVFHVCVSCLCDVIIVYSYFTRMIVCSLTLVPRRRVIWLFGLGLVWVQVVGLRHLLVTR